MVAKMRRYLIAIAICLVLSPLIAAGVGPGSVSSGGVSWGGVGWGGVARAAAEEPSREYRIKAAFIYNFAKFTLWPADSFADAATPLDFCIYGEDPFDGALDAIAGNTIRGRKVAVRRIAAIEATAGCHLLFISDSETERLTGILAALEHRPILTVAEMPNFARAGGIINLKTTEEDRLRFEINTGTAQRAGLRFSSKLLSLAEITVN
ncbi:MAG: YfiR family protein [Alphaproteobacteria bacterium]